MYFKHKNKNCSANQRAKDPQFCWENTFYQGIWYFHTTLIHILLTWQYIPGRIQLHNSFRLGNVEHRVIHPECHDTCKRSLWVVRLNGERRREVCKEEEEGGSLNVCLHLLREGHCWTWTLKKLSKLNKINTNLPDIVLMNAMQCNYAK